MIDGLPEETQSTPLTKAQASSRLITSGSSQLNYTSA